MTALASKLKRGDDVIVISGKDKGKRGKIEKVFADTNRVEIAGVNVVKKHISQREAMRLQREPGVMDKAMPVAVSNVMLVDPKTNEPTRVGYKMDDKGNKVRFAKKSGETLDVVKKVGDKK